MLKTFSFAFKLGITEYIRRGFVFVMTFHFRADDVRYTSLA
ncbi:hypothetical protein GCHA_2553 [Paraglaciecola chathamensis S18K6]|uniref:Transposase n=1 Tax=Paraglaciecola chathamensis S18K6 TaxID=1127672 RepID=A0AAV3V1F2_9ALTE|nr:hypothetical protein GCHA_2553 [Paraglaciecola chathamensis S18K6]